jgi:hypothetical protein
MIAAEAVFGRLTHRKRAAIIMEKFFIFISFHPLYLKM